ncbi:MAG: alanyl-tRNA editing protein [Chloroflexi bacterium]|nr:alanyl-tRNA editing protein [Chloroflexota bacterium]
MTTRLYYDDAYLATFTAQVVERTSVNGHPAVRLDRSAFYPTSGGQQHDTGALAGVAVIDVQVAEDASVLHLLAAPLPKEAAEVTGVIDWPRRFDHMQQHSGQHLLSQAFYRLLGLETVSVHFGDELCTLDLAGESLGAQGLEAVERHANEIVWEDRTIRAYAVSDGELANIPLRRAPQVTGKIRIVEIDDYDWSACGGTHVTRTGSIGPLSLLRVERNKGNSRVYFVCGARAVNDARRRRQLLGDAAALLDTAVEEVPSLLAARQERLKEQDRLLRAMQEELLGYRAQSLLAQAEAVGGVRLVARVLADLDPTGLKSLAAGLVATPGVVALLACGMEGKGTVIFARSADVELHAGQLLRAVLPRFGGGGGGRPDFAQGGGVDVERLVELIETARQLIG